MPCNIPGTRTLFTYSNWAVTMAGMSGLGIGFPENFHSLAGFLCGSRIEFQVELLACDKFPVADFFRRVLFRADFPVDGDKLIRGIQGVSIQVLKAPGGP